MTGGKSLSVPLGSLVRDAIRQTGVGGRALVPAVPVVNLGTVFPLPGDPAVANQVLLNIDMTRDAAIRGAAVFSSPSAYNRRAATVAMSYAEYLDAVKRGRSILADFEREAKRVDSSSRYIVPYAKSDTFRFLTEIFNRSMHTPDFQGYLNYVCVVHPNYAACLRRIAPPVLDERVRVEHTYITGGSGSGKTELLKALAHHDIGRGDRAVVIIDPQSKFSGTVARWKEFAGENAHRLVYFDPSLCRGYLPGINPLDAGHLTKSERSILAGQLTDVMAQVVTKDSSSASWTVQTGIVARNCFQVALNTKGATLRHLRLALVEPDEKTRHAPKMVKEIVRLGKRHHSPEVRTFFEYDFFKPNFASSKNSFSSKLGAALDNEIFSGVTCQPSSIHLEQLINDRKIIIFNLGAWGNLDAAGAFGRMMIAQLVAIGMRRSVEYGKSYAPVHIYVDEADKFIGPAVLTALSKLRQHGMYMTLAQQVFGYMLEPQDKQNLSINTGIKFTTGQGQREMLDAMSAPRDATHGKGKGQFVGRWGHGNSAFQLNVRSDLADQSNCMTKDDWEDVKEYQLGKYYNRVETHEDDYGQDTFSEGIDDEFAQFSLKDDGFEWEEE